ncbi:MAG: hypothetical protein SFX73_11450 [Kofleriaceae bacterium]|nr:hypothetical protein [Kofleriaceae bacterium]
MRALPLVVLLAAAAGPLEAAPRIALGETRFAHGRTVTHLDVCDATRVVAAEMGPWVRSWRLPDGAPGRAFGPYADTDTMAVACAGDLTVIGRNERAELWRGDKIVASTKIKFGVAARIVGTKAYVLDKDALHELSEQGTRVAWKPTINGIHAVVRPDLVVSIGHTSLMWSTAAKTETVTFPEELVAIADLGNAIAVVSATGVVRVLDQPTVPAPAFSFDAQKLGTPRSIGGDARWVAVGTTHGKLVQARRGGPQLPPVEVIAPNISTSVMAVRVASDHWIIGGDDQRVRRLPLGATSYTRPKVDGHTQTVWSIALDEKWLASASSDATIRLRSLDGKLARTFAPKTERPILEIGFTPTILWALDDYANLFRWKRTGLTPMKQIDRIEHAAALGANRLAVWHKQALATLDLASGAITPVGIKLEITDPELTASGDIVVVQDELHDEKPLYVIDVKAASKIAEIHRIDEATVRRVAVSPDGSQIAIAEDEVLRVWSRKTAKSVEVGKHTAPIDALAWSADGRIAAGDWTGRVNVWKPGTPKPVVELTDHMGPIYALTWRGKSLVSGGSDFRVLVTDIPD